MAAKKAKKVASSSKKKAKKPAAAPKDAKEPPKFDPYEYYAKSLSKADQKKISDIKAKLETFQKAVVKKFDKYIMGMALLPPPPAQPTLPPQLQQGMAQSKAVLPGKPLAKPAAPNISQQLPPQPGQPAPPPKDAIHLFVLVDDSDSKKMSKDELHQKLFAIIEKMAIDVDKRLYPEVMLVSDLWQSMYDGKTDKLQLISRAAAIYDRGMIAALRISEVHKSMVLKKFEKYIVSYVIAGSLVQGRATEKSDIDVFIVIDDTDVKRMTRAELKDKLRAIIIGMGIEAGEITGVRNKLNIQVYILTDFWDSIREANPIIFTFLRDGIPVYDRGIFMPWKQLLKLGKIKPSAEAIELYMSTGDQMIKRVKAKLREVGMEDTFWAILTPSQAALMMYGVPPPTPKETPEVMRDIFVKKEKILEERFVKILENNIKIRKDLEHGDLKDISGAQVDKLLKDCDDYLKRIDKLFKEIELRKQRESMLQLYDSIVAMIRDVLKLEGIEKADDTEIIKLFEDELISAGKVPAKFLRLLNEILSAKKDYDTGKLTKAEVEKVKRDSSQLIRFLVEYMQRKRGLELQRAKIRVKHGNKYGEVVLLDTTAFIIHDIDKQDRDISRGTLLPNGAITDIRRSSLEEFEKSLAESKIPPQTFIREKLFEHLKDIFGRDVEILINT